MSRFSVRIPPAPRAKLDFIKELLSNINCICVIFFLLLLNPLYAKENSLSASAQDSDGDGLSDSLEAALLARFLPVFMVNRADCSVMPARFAPETGKPTVIEDDGTIYGRAFPRKGRPEEVELHYYHLWREDCGRLGHALDIEHVSALIRPDGDAGSAKALYWYAAAHEDTICVASQLARAETVAAVDHGATVWVSSGKHGSFLSRDFCDHGCGGDNCEQAERLNIRDIVNLGEIGAPMNGIGWLLSTEWPLRDKLRRSDFTDARLASVDNLQRPGLVWANPSKRPAQSAILGVNSGIGGAATGVQATDTALEIANDNTDAAIGAAAQKTGKALNRSSMNVLEALRKSAQKTREFLHRNEER